MFKKIPPEIIQALEKLKSANFEAHLVGGCVRDLILNKMPNDWDITTNAEPAEIIKIFGEEKTFYKNNFFTVGLKNEDGLVGVIEITTHRNEFGYSDKRRPDVIKKAQTLEEDLCRRDFTINAMALELESPQKIKIIDPFNGRVDLKNKIIRTVGNATDRFSEDALRILRAIRFHAQLGFEIEENTLLALKKQALSIKHVAMERIGDEFSKIILSENPVNGIELLRQSKILSYLIPELEAGIEVTQNHHHIYTVYDHCLFSLKYCPSKKLTVRLAALFHDIAKPQTKKGQGKNASFYNHEYLGAKISEKILKRLRFSSEIIEGVKLLVANHMFYYNPDEVTESSVRKLIQKVGLENMQDLIDLRISDRLGSGTPKAKPYKLRHLEYLIEKVSKDAISVKMLKINGFDLVEKIKLAPGPKMGAILDILLAEVIDDPSLNNPTYLLKKAQQLNKNDLGQLRGLAKEKIEEKIKETDLETKKKYWVN